MAPSAPRLRIAHLMLWTACTAAFLTVQRLEIAAEGASTGRLALLVAWAVFAGPSIAALLVFPFWRRANYRFPMYAGEWLLLILGSATVLVAAQSVAIKALFARQLADPFDYETFFRLWRISQAILCGMTTILGILSSWALISLKGRRAWRCFFAALALLLTLIALAQGSQSLKLMLDAAAMEGARIVLYVVAALLPLTLIVAVCRDFSRPQRLPWTHWLGVALFVLQVGLVVISMIRLEPL